MTRDILINDRLWFDRNPFAIVRFRRQHAEEFAQLIDQNQQAPVFVPSFCTMDRVHLSWVAVVDVFQLLRDCNASADGTRLRLRMQTPPLRRADQRAKAREELIQAVATELLDQALMAEAMSCGWNAA